MEVKETAFPAFITDRWCKTHEGWTESKLLAGNIGLNCYISCKDLSGIKAGWAFGERGSLDWFWSLADTGSSGHADPHPAFLLHLIWFDTIHHHQHHVIIIDQHSFVWKKNVCIVTQQQGHRAAPTQIPLFLTAPCQVTHKHDHLTIPQGVSKMHV